MPGYLSYLSIFNQYLLILTPGPQRKKKKKVSPLTLHAILLKCMFWKKKEKRAGNWHFSSQSWFYPWRRPCETTLSIYDLSYLVSLFCILGSWNFNPPTHLGMLPSLMAKQCMQSENLQTPVLQKSVTQNLFGPLLRDTVFCHGVFLDQSQCT